MSHLVIECDIAIIGASLGGVAAALSAAAAGKKVVLSEQYPWIGGQITSQGVAPLDEHPLIETFGGTRRYAALRQAIREEYQRRYAAAGENLNPGGGWVSRLCFEPRVGLQVIESLLAPWVANGNLILLRGHMLISAHADGDNLIAVTLRGADGQDTALHAAYFLDATDLGALLPLAEVEYVSGAEAIEDTGEPHASRDGAKPGEVQGFTFSFAVEFVPETDNTISRPAGYAAFRDQQPYTLTLRSHDGEDRRYWMFGGDLPFWTYRRIFDGTLDGSRDIALINWAGNDFHGGSLIDAPPGEQARILDEAKRLSLSFLYWLQTEAPRDEGGLGYRELRLRPDVLGTADGLSQAPYIRESRRIVPLQRIVEQDISAAANPGPRARLFPDSVGVGWYAMDLHACVGNPEAGRYAATRPFQIPLGALIPRRMGNVIAACKNIGTTHLTNGAYRLHPVEWNIGESAGLLAVFCCDHHLTPRKVWLSPERVRQFQKRLLAEGIPLAWGIDIPPGHELFVPSQFLLLAGCARPDTLEVQPEREITLSPEQRARLGLPLPAEQRWTWAGLGRALTPWL